MDFEMNKKAQITVFIIIGVFLFVAVALFFIFVLNMDINFTEAPQENPTLFLESCIKGKVQEGANTILKQGGYIENNLAIEFTFSDGEVANVSYLCYNQNYYSACKNQEPMLISNIEKELKNFISNEVETCFDEQVYSLREEGYDVEKEYSGFDVELAPKKILINVDGKIVLTRADATSSYEDFAIVSSSRLYDLAVVAQEIVSQEARFCNFDYVGFMILYPNYNINKIQTGNSIIYRIEHEVSKEKFQFAVRGCVIPPGI